MGAMLGKPRTLMRLRGYRASRAGVGSVACADARGGALLGCRPRAVIAAEKYRGFG